MLETEDLFLSSPVSTLRLFLSCQFPVAFCEGKGQRSSWFLSAINSWHITGVHREKGRSLPDLGCRLFLYEKPYALSP